MLFSLRQWAVLTALAWSEAFSAQPMVARPGRKFCSKTRTLAPSILSLIPIIPRQSGPPWSAYPPTTTGGAIYKSTDGGTTWNPVTGGGLPAGDWGRVGLAIARGTHGQRVYALIDTKEGGVFKSDDGGQTWAHTGKDPRIGRLWYFGEIYVDPKNPDTVYVPNVSIYRSTDAGKNFVAIKGAPGGDDYHALWIDPSNPQRMIFGSDQGAGVSVDTGP